MRTTVFLAGVIAIGSLAACEKEVDLTGPATQLYTATLNGAGERPTAVTTNGSGTFTGTISEGNFLHYTITWSGLSSASNNGHFHGPITPGSNAAAGVLIDLNAPTAGRTITHSNASGGAGSAAGFIDLNVALSATVSADSLRKLLDNGGLYINIHTVNNTGGEIAGVVTKQ
jgi:hypothetical protein